MTTIDLRMMLAQEIQNIPDSEQMLMKAINYVRSLSRRKDVAFVLTGDALRLWNRTLELAELTVGWDGAQALPMEKKALQNMQRLIKAGESTDFRQWVLFPEDGKASISIGNNSYSFVCTKEGKFNAGQNVKFSTASALKTLRSLA